MTTETRPAPPYEITEPGWEWRAEIDTDWTTERPWVQSHSLKRPAADRCRFGVPPHQVPAAAWLFRPVWRSDAKKKPWAYCADHLYGRWIEDGHVMEWNVHDTDEAQP